MLIKNHVIFPKETKSQAVGRLGEDAFFARAPKNWILTKLEKNADFGLDFMAQISVAGEVKHIIFIQIKSSLNTHLEKEKNKFKCYLDAKTINYIYHNNLTTLLVFCDFTKTDDKNLASLYYQWILPLNSYITEVTPFKIEIPKNNLFHKDLDISHYLKNLSNRGHQVYSFGSIESISDSHCIFANSTASLQAILPSQYGAYRMSACLINLNFPGTDECLFSFGHKKIVTLLLKGAFTHPAEKKSGFIAFSNDEHNNSFFLDFGNCRIHLTSSHVNDICDIVDKFSDLYIKKLIFLENLHQSRQYAYNSTMNGWELIRVTKNFWFRMLEFAQNHDKNNGNSKWHIFSFSHNYIIFFDEKGNYVQLTPAQRQGAQVLINEDDAVYICWAPLNKNASSYVSCLEIWNCNSIHEWITKKFIPQVVVKLSDNLQEKNTHWFYKLFKRKKENYPCHNHFDKYFISLRKSLDICADKAGESELNFKKYFFSLGQWLCFSNIEKLCIYDKDIQVIYEALYHYIKQIKLSDYSQVAECFREREIGVEDVAELLPVIKALAFKALVYKNHHVHAYCCYRAIIEILQQCDYQRISTVISKKLIDAFDFAVTQIKKMKLIERFSEFEF